jgi:DNA mismatch repair protein MutH
VSGENNAVFVARVQRAKRVSAVIVGWLASTQALLVPSGVKAALGDVAVLLVDLAQLSHPAYDFSELVKRLETLETSIGENLIVRSVSIDGKEFSLADVHVEKGKVDD